MPYRRSSAVQARLDAQETTILRCAIDVLARRGYRGLSIAAVASDAGVATGTVYKHFGSKAGLATAVFREAVGREVEAVVSAAALPGNAAARVGAGVETFAARAMKNPKLAYALLVETVDEEVDAERHRYRSRFADAFASAIADGVASGELVPQDPQFTAAALVGAVGEILVGPLGGVTTIDVVADLVTFSVRALGVRDAHA